VRYTIHFRSFEYESHTVEVPDNVPEDVRKEMAWNLAWYMFNHAYGSGDMSSEVDYDYPCIEVAHPGFTLTDCPDAYAEYEVPNPTTDGSAE